MSGGGYSSSGMRKYFQIQNYSGNIKARVAIFNMNGREYIWWDYLRKVKRINETNIKWKQFKKYFKEKYLYDMYYDGKIREFHVLKIGENGYGRICKQILGADEICC